MVAQRENRSSKGIGRRKRCLFEPVYYLDNCNGEMRFSRARVIDGSAPSFLFVSEVCWAAVARFVARHSIQLSYGRVF